MNSNRVRVRELAAWGFDEYEYRGNIPNSVEMSGTAHRMARDLSFRQSEVLLADETAALREALLAQVSRPDLIAEMLGLEWSLGVVDVRPLIAFQRRLVFDPQIALPLAPEANDWGALMALSFGREKSIEYELIHDAVAQTIVLRSSNPNLHFRTSSDPAAPLAVHAGGPFFEVACFRGRWFLRDGYHRAYTLLKAGIFAVPAVIVQAQTIEELGATQPWFFPEEILFSEIPPLVTDFLDDDVVLEYDRPAMVRTLQITMQERLVPAPFLGDEL
jgi:hypothetical protein